MTAIGRVLVATFFGVLSVWAAAGCREKSPTRSHNYDLSEDDVALLPTGSPTKNASFGNVQKNRADWVAFRDPADVPEGPSSKPVAAEKPGEVSDDVVTELKEIVEDYNDVIADGDVEGMLEYFVEDQQAVAERYLNAAKSLGGAVAKLRESLSGEAADAGAPIIALLDRLVLASSLVVSIESMEASDQDDVTGQVAGKPGIVPSLETLEFTLVDDEWFFRIASPAAVEGWAESAERATKDLAPLLDLAKDDAGDADELLSKLQTAARGLLVDEAAPADEHDEPHEADDEGEPTTDDDGDGSDEDDGDASDDDDNGDGDE